MPWWVFLLIAVLGYVAGFLASGVAYSHLFSPRVNRADMLWAMFGWPVFFIPYLIGLGILKYVTLLERNRTQRAIKVNVPKNVTKLPTSGQVTTLQTNRWED